MSDHRALRQRILPLLAILAVAVLVAACQGGTIGPAGATPTPSAVPHPPLVPASPGSNPVDLLAWLFNPIFQLLFIGLVWVQKLTSDVLIAIVVVTLVIRTLLIPLFRRQIVSMKRMQLLQPELHELQRRYKGDRAKLSQAQMELYKERGVNPVGSGCLPVLLQFPLLIIVYSVISNGLTNPNPTAMFSFAGVKLVDYTCVNHLGTAAYNDLQPCIDTLVHWAGGFDVSTKAVVFPDNPLLSWFSILAAIAAVLQLVQSRMTMPPATADYSDQSSKMQRQLVLFLPLISLVYGGFLPAGLFIYWITTTIFGIVQQYLIVGWGSMFPLFGWSPGFARDHTPRFPVDVAPLRTSSGTQAGRASPATPQSRPTERTPGARAASAAATVRPRERGRQGRRGRKR